jgi:glycosyltransferase involved in cell wall biosynthesis
VNVVFVNYYDFTSNSAIHIFNLANELAAMGIGCAVAVPDKASTVERIGVPDFQPLDFRAARRGALRFPDGGGPTLVHAWTPREAVRELTEELSARYGCPYFVHLEDNEDLLTADSLGLSLEQVRSATAADLDGSVPPGLAHPVRMRRFLAGSAGMTVIIDRLLEFRPNGVPAEVVWPAYERELFTADPPDRELRRGLGIRDEEVVLVYAGNTHVSNAAEVRSLYLAVAALNRGDRSVKLVRLGRDFVQFLDPELESIAQHVVRVPPQPREEVPRYMRLADVLVQPGRAGGFNDYRLPSKLPEFLATGRPVVLPATNLGRSLEDGVECILLQRGDALEIAAAVERILDDDALATRLAAAARAFAERSFSWRASAEKLHGFYERALGSTPRPVDTHDVHVRPAGDRPQRVSYATVRDYCDSAERLPELATANGDLKDVQRPWALKTILAAIPSGSRLLEIGAGEPIVAGRLAQLGYDVTVIDPYDGRDRGPSEYDELSRRYPRVRMLRGLFPGDVPAGETFDCMYSISVLEHLPLGAVDAVCRGIVNRTRGYTVHAIDHVLKGAGAEDHLVRLRQLAVGLGVEAGELEDALAALVDDPETYFLSAESHNRWRGSTPYDEFPMRRCVSIQLCVPVGGP